jgi:lysyl-tRNA synthetase class 2
MILDETLGDIPMKRLGDRARVLGVAREFFASRGFLEVHTPLMVPSPGLDVHLDAFEVVGGDRGAPRWLITSPEYQMKRLLADGWERIVEIVPCFRRDEIGAWHNAEFTMIEWYRGGASVEDVIRDTEQLVSAVGDGTLRVHGRAIDALPPFERLSVCEAFRRFAGWTEAQTLDRAAADEDSFYRALVERVEPELARMDRATFMVDYPASQASLARPKPGDPRVAERFELYIGGVELCNGFGELIDPVEQRRRLESDRQLRRSLGLPVYPIDERFLDALSRVPPSAGNALGFDRLVALATGSDRIGEVMSMTVDEV